MTEEAEISQVEVTVGFDSFVHQPVLVLHKLLLTWFVVHHLIPSGPCTVGAGACLYALIAAAVAIAAAVHWH